MKTILAVLGLAIMPFIEVLGTPDRSVEIVEDFFGSNETGFAILRTETDSLGRYYTNRVRKFLDEYEKTPKDEGRTLAIAKRVKSALLLDAKYTQGLDAEPSEEILAQDSSVAFADLLKKYPTRGAHWTRERLEKLLRGKNQGVYAGNLGVVSQFEITTEVFGFEKDDHDSVLEAVMEDMNCLYLCLSTGTGGDEGDRQTRWVCNVPAKTAQIHAHLALEPLCLAAGTHKTLEEAVKRGQDILKKAATEKYPLNELQVWSVTAEIGGPVFTVAISGVLAEIKPEKFERLKKLMGSDLSPTSTGHFQECTWVRKSES